MFFILILSIDIQKLICKSNFIYYLQIKTKGITNDKIMQIFNWNFQHLGIFTTTHPNRAV